MNNKEALAKIRKQYTDDEGAVEAICAFIEDDERDPDIADEIMIIVHAIPGMWRWEIDDVSTDVLHEALIELDPEFADTFADVNGFCRKHSCDPKICEEDLGCEGF